MRSAFHQYGRSALHCAASSSCTEVVDMLISFGADVNIQNNVSAYNGSGVHMGFGVATIPGAPSATRFAPHSIEHSLKSNARHCFPPLAAPSYHCCVLHTSDAEMDVCQQCCKWSPFQSTARLDTDCFLTLLCSSSYSNLPSYFFGFALH